MSKGLTFSQFIANIMQRTAGVSSSTRFGDAVNSWAKVLVIETEKREHKFDFALVNACYQGFVFYIA